MHLLRDSFIYLVCSGINKGIPFFLLPIITRFMLPESYGVWAIYQMAIAFSIPLVGMILQTNITRTYYVASKEELAKLISNLFLVLVISSFSFLMLTAVSKPFLRSLFPFSINWLYALPLIAFGTMLIQFNLVILRNQRRPMYYGLFEIGSTILNLSIAIITLVWFKIGWESMAYGILVATTVFGALSFLRIYAENFFSWDWNCRIIRKSLQISLPLVPHALSSIVIAMSDRLFLEKMLGLKAVGIYAAGYTFGMIVLLFTDSFNKAWSPHMYKELASIDEIKKQSIIRFTYAYGITILAFAVVVTLVSRSFLIQYMLAEKYHAAKEFVIWVALGYAVEGIYFMVFPYMVHTGRTNFLAINTVVGALFKVGSNYLLIKSNGIAGAAQATLIAYTVMSLGALWYANRVFPMPWLSREIWRTG